MITEELGIFYNEEISLLEKSKKRPIELSSVAPQTKYVDIFNSTVVIYEDLKSKCKRSLNLQLTVLLRNNRSE